jgi:hypothetical protein
VAVGIWLLIGAAVVGLLAWVLDRRRRAYTDLATTPAAAVFAGRNEVKGRAWAAEPLTSRRTSTASVWWKYTLEEERTHTRTVTTTDSQGHSHTHTETYTEWHKVDEDGGTLTACEVVDDTGSVGVHLGAGAHIEPRQVFQDIFRNADERGFLAKLFDFDSRTGRYRETEKAVAVGDQLFVVGNAVLDDERGIPYLSDALVSTRSEESRTQGLGIGVGALVILALIGAAAGSGFALAREGEGMRPLGMLPGLGVAVLLLVAAWSLTTYNRLHLMAQGVGRAAALVDVQLKRRHDLIPALVDVVTAHAAHERGRLEELTRLRSTGSAGGAAADAATQTAELRQVLAVAEGYPELTADQSFLNLQHQLADTEARIAGSRTFYNDTVTLLRDRSRKFPGVLVARLVPQAQGDLVATQGFERTVPAMAHAFG